MMAILLMTMTAWTLQILYVNLLKGSKISDARRSAIIEADTLLRLWQRKALEHWPEDETEVIVESEHGEYFYKVELSGLTANPFKDDPALESTGDPYLNLRTVTLELTYKEKTRNSETNHKVKLVGSASR
jgi:hypothetical protein